MRQGTRRAGSFEVGVCALVRNPRWVRKAAWHLLETRMLRKMRNGFSPLALFLGLTFLGLTSFGCSTNSASKAKLPLDDMTSATPAIRKASDAVVLVTMPGFTATAAFISPDGMLLTNNHVLGVAVCPIEGCYAQLTWSYELGASRQQPVTVFLVPNAVDVGLDMAVLQASSTRGGPALATPNYLTIDSRDPASLQGSHVTVVGHPEGSVKKWSSGEVIDADGSWVTTSAFILPGSSGSPLLDDDGHLVGLMHRSPEGEDLITQDGLNASSVGTGSSALIAAMAAPLPSSMVSIAASATATSAVTNQLLYLSARTAVAVVDGAPEQVLADLGTACDAALAVTDYASPDALTTALAPCLEAENWIECRSDANSPYGICPDTPADWHRRYVAVFEYWRSFNGQLMLDEMSFAEAALASSVAAGQTAGAALLTQALGEAQPVLDFHVAAHLAAFPFATVGEATSVPDFTRHYATVPDYAANGKYLANTILWLRHSGAMSDGDTQNLLAALHDDPAIDLGTKLYIEREQYNLGILH